MKKNAIASLILVVLVVTLTNVFWRTGTGASIGTNQEERPENAAGEQRPADDVAISQGFLRDSDYPAVVKQVDTLLNSNAHDRYTIKNFQAQFPGWLALMRQGDLKAAKSIWEATLKCSRQGIAPFSPESFRDMNEDEERYAKEANRLPRKRRLMEIATLYAACGNITREQRIAGLEGLKLLAESGDWSARSDFIQFGRPDVSNRAQNRAKSELWEYRKKATEYLEAEVLSGNVDAMKLSSALHGDNDFASERNVLDHDPVRALAYHLAATNVLRTRLKESPPADPREYANLADQVSAMERDGASLSMIVGNGQQSLSAEQISEATRLALEIESRCCK